MSRCRMGRSLGLHKFNNLKADEVFSRTVGDQWPYCRFYERAVKIKHLTADRPTGRKPIVAASPASVETNDFNQLCRHSAPHHNAMSSSETEKQCGRAMIADHGSIRVSVDYCFSRSCEGG